MLIRPKPHVQTVSPYSKLKIKPPDLTPFKARFAGVSERVKSGLHEPQSVNSSLSTILILT